MQAWILLIAIGILLQIANLFLRRFKLGRQVIRVSGYLSSLFLIGVVTDFIGIGERLRIPINANPRLTNQKNDKCAKYDKLESCRVNTN